MKKIKKLEKNGIFTRKATSPVHFINLYGVNQLGAIDRDGSFDSWDFVGSLKSVCEYETHWCQKGTGGFGFLGTEVLKTGFMGQAQYIGIY